MPESYCTEYTRDRSYDKPKTSLTRRGYDQVWRSLSERARRMQASCSDC